MCFCNNRYTSGTLGGAVFKLPGYLRDMVFMIPIYFYADLSSGSKDFAIYDKFQNGRQVVQSILVKFVSF